MVSTVAAVEKAVLHGDTRIKCPSNGKIVRIFTSSTFTGKCKTKLKFFIFDLLHFEIVLNLNSYLQR